VSFGFLEGGGGVRSSNSSSKSKEGNLFRGAEAAEPAAQPRTTAGAFDFEGAVVFFVGGLKEPGFSVESIKVLYSSSQRLRRDAKYSPKKDRDSSNAGYLRS
jgi:hypothetical protein